MLQFTSIMIHSEIWLEGEYQYPYGERVTPVEEIPDEFRREAVLPGGQHQTVDRKFHILFILNIVI